MENNILCPNIEGALKALELGRIHIALGKIKTCLSILKDLQLNDNKYDHLKKEFTILSSDFHSNNKKEKLDIEDRQLLRTNQNRIVSGLFDLINAIKNRIGEQESRPESKSSMNASTQKEQPEKTNITITLDRDPEDLTEKQQTDFLSALSLLLKLGGGDLNIKKIEKGSTIITLEIPKAKAVQLEQFFHEDLFPDWDIMELNGKKPFKIPPKLWAIIRDRKIKYKIDSQVLKLNDADLSGADLSSAYLESVDFTDADLSQANLQKATLINVNLSRAIFWRADLDAAYLRNSTLEGTYLIETNLTNIDLTEVRLNNAILKRIKTLSGAKLDKADLSGMDLSNTNLQHTSLNGANLRMTNLKRADLSDAKLEQANLEKADLSSAILTNTLFRNANLRRAILVETHLEETNFSGADLTGADLSEITSSIPYFKSGKAGTSIYLNNTILKGASLDKFNLQSINLDEADLSGVDLSEAKLSKASLHRTILRGALLSKVDLSGAGLSSADLSGAVLSYANLSGANFQNADLRGAILKDIRLEDVNFENANLAGSVFHIGQKNDLLLLGINTSRIIFVDDGSIAVDAGDALET